MSRINIGINPQQLIDKHLLAEHREIKRICYLFKNRLKQNKFDDIPPSYNLGKGSIKFFLDKGLYTHKRYLDILSECAKRGFEVTSFNSNWQIYHDNRKYANDYKPNDLERSLTKARIKDRINTMIDEPRYYKNKITRQQAKKLLNKN